MTEDLLGRLAVGKISVNLFEKWLDKCIEGKIEEFNGFKCTKSEFLTYFLNFVHEEISGTNKCDSPEKNTSKQISVSRKYSTPNETDISRSATFPPTVNRSLEKSFDTVSIEDRLSSTPKVRKNHVDSIIDSTYLSPISPLYRNNCNFSSPNQKSHNNERIVPLCLGDFILQKKSSTKKKAVKTKDESNRRIKPTCLNQVSINGSLRKSSNSFNNFNTSEIESDSSLASRDTLLEERLRILSRKDSDETIQTISKRKNSESIPNDNLEIYPDVKSITYKKEIDNISAIYVTILKCKLVLNIFSEIYFLISLLLKRFFHDDSSDHFYDDFNEICEAETRILPGKVHCCREYFKSIHNVVYFAVKCIESQIDILKYLDKSTLMLLALNKRLKAFNASLADKLRILADEKCERIIEILDENTTDSTTNVCFNSDTDNRDNFPNDVSFNAFRKQRDLFYEILRIWQHNHLQPGWSFSVGLAGKIKSLLSMQADAINFMHFARLFKAQLLNTCARTQKEAGLSEDQSSIFSSLPNVDKVKMNRLKNRLITKQSTAGLNALPTFTGHEEFYKDFIINASNHMFNSNLCDILISEIIELNDSKYVIPDLEDSADGVDCTTRKAFSSRVGCLRLLAKFLGFMCSLPYKSELKEYSDQLLATQIKIREKIRPSFDVKQLLLESLEQGTLVISVPWIVIYLAMLDYVTVRLPYYISVHQILFQIYRTDSDNTNKTLRYNNALINFNLGWLFELSHFPDQEYFNFCEQREASTNSMKCNNNLTVDNLDVVDQNFLYVCCPYLEEIKKLLSNNVQNKCITIKHITPISAVQSSEEINKKKLEVQLEEAFFNGQPASVRKTVEFVSERIASACIKHICYTIVPEFKSKAVDDLKIFLANWSENCLILSPVRDKAHKSSLRGKISQMAQSNVIDLKRECGKVVSQILEEKIPPSLNSLLAIESLPQTKMVSTAVTSKMCKERIKQWVMTHITVSIFMKDFDNEMQKAVNFEMNKKEKPIFALPAGGKETEHDDGCLSAFHLLERVKLLSIDVMENSQDISGDSVTNLLNDAIKTLDDRCDVNQTITSTLCSTLVSLALLLLTHRTDILPDENRLQLFIKIWRHYYGNNVEDLFRNVLCPRNVLLLAQSCNDRQSWQNLAEFLAFLIKEHVLSTEMFEAQCTAFFKKDWDEITLKNVSFFLRQFIHYDRQNGGDVDKFTLLLEVLSEFCTDIATFN